MTVTVNGRDRDLPDGAVLADAVAAVSGAPAGLAVALNDDVVPRADWATTRVHAGDRIEVLTAVQGG